MVKRRFLFFQAARAFLHPAKPAIAQKISSEIIMIFGMRLIERNIATLSFIFFSQLTFPCI